ncbi:MAG: DMT family transporter [Pseudomonadota bacterium]
MQITAETTRYALIMLAAGIGIPILAALNASLGARIGSPVAAVVLLFGVAMSAALVIGLISGEVRALGRIADQPPHLFLAGLLVLFYVLSITWVAPHFGIGNAIFFVLLGQIISAAMIDQFGLFGAPVQPISAARAAGLALMGAGVFLAQKG